MRRVYLYARVSTTEQNCDRQITEMKELCAQKGLEVIDKFIFTEEASGKDFENRPVYQKLKSMLYKGDILCIHELSRLSRNFLEGKAEVAWLADNGIDLLTVKFPIDTLSKSEEETPLSRLMWRQNYDNIISNLFYMAELERLFILERSASGIAEAKRKNIAFGRPGYQVVNNEEFLKIAKMWNANKITDKVAMELTLSRARVKYMTRLPEDKRDYSRPNPNVGDGELLKQYPGPKDRTITRGWFRDQVINCLKDNKVLIFRGKPKEREQQIEDLGLTQEDVARLYVEMLNCTLEG